MIYANCRDRFTADDFDFIVKTLGRSQSDSVTLPQLLTDKETLDGILEHPLLVDSILTQTDHLRISPQLYFYVLVRHVLKQTADKRVCDYIAALLDTFTRTAGMRAPVNGAEGPVQYLSDMMLALQRATPRESFLIRVHVGNYSLFITGIFRETIERRSSRGAPDCRFYEEMGSANFQVAARCNEAKQCELSGVYDRLGSGFHEVRLGLNRLAENLLSFDAPQPILLTP